MTMMPSTAEATIAERTCVARSRCDESMGNDHNLLRRHPDLQRRLLLVARVALIAGLVDPPARLQQRAGVARGDGLHRDLCGVAQVARHLHPHSVSVFGACDIAVTTSQPRMRRPRRELAYEYLPSCEIFRGTA